MLLKRIGNGKMLSMKKRERGVRRCRDGFGKCIQSRFVLKPINYTFNTLKLSQRIPVILTLFPFRTFTRPYLSFAQIDKLTRSQLFKSLVATSVFRLMAYPIQHLRSRRLGYEMQLEKTIFEPCIV